MIQDPSWNVIAKRVQGWERVLWEVIELVDLLPMIGRALASKETRKIFHSVTPSWRLLFVINIY